MKLTVLSAEKFNGMALLLLLEEVKGEADTEREIKLRDVLASEQAPLMGTNPFPWELTPYHKRRITPSTRHSPHQALPRESPPRPACLPPSGPISLRCHTGGPVSTRVLLGTEALTTSRPWQGLCKCLSLCFDFFWGQT